MHTDPRPENGTTCSNCSPPSSTVMPSTTQALPCTQIESSNVSSSLLHQDSDTDVYPNPDINMCTDDPNYVDTQVTSPIQFIDEPPTDVETVTVTVGSVKSDPDTMAKFLCSSADTLPVHVSPKMENEFNIEMISHALPSGTTLKWATVKLWTIPKAVAPEKGLLKVVRVILDKHNMSTSYEGTLSMKHSKNKDKN